MPRLPAAQACVRGRQESGERDQRPGALEAGFGDANRKGEDDVVELRH